MRKLYALLAVTLLSFAAQARPVSPDIANFNYSIDHPNNSVVFINTTVLGSEPGIRKAFWTFGDGTGTITPPLQGTAHQYQSSGTYTVCLKIYRYRPAINDSVLSAQVCKTFTIATLCRADFEKLPIAPAANPLRAYFKALPWHNGNKRPVRICWNFGDNSDTCIQYSNTNPGPYIAAHTYAAPGSYEVCVKIFYDGGCGSMKCKSIRMERPDTCGANFERIPSPVNNPLLVYFKALPQHNNNRKPARICWEFGDNRDTCINYTENYTGLYAVSHRYDHPGTYEVCVRILYYGGCEARKCRPVEVARPDTCHADFEKIPPTANDLLLTYFRALPQHNNNRKPARICWNFGDNRDTCINYTENYTGQYIVRHRYEHPGSYEVCVRILYFGGCEAHKCEIVRIGRPDTCQADFERIPSPNDNPLHVYFKALPQHNNNRKPARVCWEFGDNRDTCINYPENYTGQYAVSHRYEHPGLYEVCVKILYYGGCEARKCHAIQVGRPDTCHADFEKILGANDNPLRAYFRALPQHNNNRKPARICWDFGDNQDTCINYPENYTGQYVVNHRYNQPGLYEVCVRIIYYGGCEARKCERVRIGDPERCEADFERIPSPNTDPLLVYLKALPQHDNNRKPARICWTFGDGRDTCINYPETYTGLYAVGHRYNHTGEYEVCVRIIYYGGCEARKCKNIVVQELHCGVRLFEITPSITSLVRGFLALPNSNPVRRPLRVCWTFGDGEDTCIMVDPQYPLPYFLVRHTYPAPGVYRACVRILFDGGCLAEDCKEVVIRPLSEICGGYMRDSMMAPRTFKFRGFSIHNPNDDVISYQWTFGDGSTAVGQDITHTYSNGGNYEVCLRIRTRLGCETRICNTIRVPGNNEPALRLSPNPVENILHAEFFSTHTEQVNIKILNGTGIVVRMYTRNVTVGPNTWNFDVTSLTPGVYSFVIQSPNQLASAIFIKQ